VLGRLSRLGVGISTEQRNDFMWFKDTWDKKMLEEHGLEWPVLFAGWAQRLINQHETDAPLLFSCTNSQRDALEMVSHSWCLER